MWQKCVFQRAWEEHVEKWTKKIWIYVKPIGKFTRSSCWKSMDVPSPYTWPENPLLWKCWGNHWRTSALEVVVIHPERQRSCKNGVVHLQILPKNVIIPAENHRKRPSFPIILDRAKPQPGPHTNGWRVPGKRRKAGASPAGNWERIAVDLPTFNGKWIWVKTLYPWWTSK